MFGWSYSKVVIPIADFHAPFFSFLFFIVIYGEKKKADKSLWTYRLYFVAWGNLHGNIVYFAERVNCILLEAVNNVQIPFSHSHRSVSQQA